MRGLQSPTVCCGCDVTKGVCVDKTIVIHKTNTALLYSYKACNYDRTSGMAAAAAVDPGRCHCSEFVLCTPEGLASTLLRLPNVSSPASPWYAYLRAVYHSLPPLPITLRGRLELLYPALLPAPVCLSSSPLLRKRWALPLCDAAVCAEWMPDPPAPSEAVANYAANGTFIMASALNESDRRPFGHAVVLQPPIATRRPAMAATGWVEVVRQAAQCPEGWSNSGCWFHQAKGSGVWVSTSPRSLILSAGGGLWDDGRRVSFWKPLASWEPWEQAGESCAHHHQCIHPPGTSSPFPCLPRRRTDSSCHALRSWDFRVCRSLRA
jgi:hypothetical protein